MNHRLNTIVSSLIKDPKRIFLIDAMGALLTACLVGIGLVSLQDKIGISIKTLYVLAGLATCIGLYSLTCYFLLKNNWARFINYLAIINFLYCLLTASMIFMYQRISLLGIAYFSIEIIIIFYLVIIERNLAQKLKNHE